MKILKSFLATFFLSYCLQGSVLHAGTQDAAANTPSEADEGNRYGLFNWLDHRSQYGAGVFPEPFLVDDSDLETGEARYDWLCTTGPGHTSGNFMTAELEKGFGLLTLEIEVPYEFDKSPLGNTHGFDNFDLGARYPIYQFVSRGGLVDSTFGVAMEVGVPVHTVFSKNTEIVPKVFNDLKIGNFTLQSILGLSMLRGGGGEDAGLDTYEYGFVFGYAIQRPFKGVEQFIPVFELVGERELNNSDAGHNTLIGNAGFRINLRAVGRFQPRLGLGYVFPIDNGAREELRKGLYTSLVFEF